MKASSTRVILLTKSCTCCLRITKFPSAETDSSLDRADSRAETALSTEDAVCFAFASMAMISAGTCDCGSPSWVEGTSASSSTTFSSTRSLLLPLCRPAASCDNAARAWKASSPVRCRCDLRLDAAPGRPALVAGTPSASGAINCCACGESSASAEIAAGGGGITGGRPAGGGGMVVSDTVPDIGGGCDGGGGGSGIISSFAATSLTAVGGGAVGGGPRGGGGTLGVLADAAPSIEPGRSAIDRACDKAARLAYASSPLTCSSVGSDTVLRQSSGADVAISGVLPSPIVVLHACFCEAWSSSTTRSLFGALLAAGVPSTSPSRPRLLSGALGASCCTTPYSCRSSFLSSKLRIKLTTKSLLLRTRKRRLRMRFCAILSSVRRATPTRSWMHSLRSMKKSAAVPDKNSLLRSLHAA
mmetsp:Transcript_10967/g.28211  ORF Transcript_10967/g.28211 Transcript_10967/m.28211 type:complete len:415 (-) Transcript_10967:106-1350(-)